MGDQANEAQALTHLGDAFDACGDTAAARDRWQQALAILDTLQIPPPGRFAPGSGRPELPGSLLAQVLPVGP